MNKNNKFNAIVLTFFLFLTSILSSVVHAAEVQLNSSEKQFLLDNPVLRLSPDPDFLPIEAVNSDGQYIGMAADYMALIEKKAGIQFKVVTYPSWKEVYADAQVGNVDVLAAITPSEKRKEFLNFATPHIKLPGMIIVSDHTSGDVTLDDLKDMKVASPAGYIWFDLIGTDHPEIKLLEAKNLKAGLRDLSFGIIDAVIADPATVTQVIKDESLSNLRIGGETGYFFNLAFATRKDWPILRDILNKTVNTITEEEHQDIFNKWIQFSGTGLSTNLIIAISSGFALVLLLALGFMLVNRLLRKQVDKQTKDLNVANTELSTLNIGLEERVQERTTDLEKAYSALKKSQLKMVQSEKMAALGQMVAGVAHEINTPLGYAHSNVVMMSDFVEKVKYAETSFNQWVRAMSNEKSSEDEISSLFEEVNAAFEDLNEDDGINECSELVGDTIYGLEQITDITQNLKDFSRVDQSEMAKVNLNDNIKRTLKLVRDQLKDHIHVNLELGDIPDVYCNPSKINQVLLNVITNGCHAIIKSGCESGLIVIKSKCVDDKVTISIRDNGSGIPKEIGRKIFDPFYTTKAPGEGTGLGLSITYNIIIKDHNGKINIQSKEGSGTKFSFSLGTEKMKNDEVNEQTAISVATI